MYLKINLTKFHMLSDFEEACQIFPQLDMCIPLMSSTANFKKSWTSVINRGLNMPKTQKFTLKYLC